MRRVPSPMRCMSSHSSLCSLSTKLIDMGRRRNVVADPSTSTSTNCPGFISGSVSSCVSFSRQ